MLQALSKILPWTQAPPVRPKFDWDWTPDQWKLEQFFEQLLFVADDMKTGGKNHHIVRDITPGAIPRNPIVYTHNKFLAYKHDLGKEHSTALILPPEYKPTGYFNPWDEPVPCKIQGELYAVQANKIYLLDKHMQNGVRFVRQRVKITYPWRYVSYGKDHPLPKISPHSYNDRITAWAYIGVPNYWDPMIGGVLAKAMARTEHIPPRPWIGEFYKLDFK